VPDEDKIEKRAGKIAQEFKSLVFPDGYQPGTKRKASVFDVKYRTSYTFTMFCT
jgi:hypothetical protein